MVSLPLRRSERLGCAFHEGQCVGRFAALALLPCSDPRVNVFAALPEAGRLLAGFSNVVAMRELVEQRSRHRGVTELPWPFDEHQISGDDDLVCVEHAVLIMPTAAPN